MTDQNGNEAEVELCTLCEACGFIKGSQVGVLKEELGLNEIIDNQILFPCHKHLVAYNGFENQGAEEMVAETGKLKVCTGFVQSLVKSGIKPKNRAMAYLMSTIDKVDDRIMSIDETKQYHSKG